MSKLERSLPGMALHEVVHKVEQGVLNASFSASLEDSWDYQDGDTRCAVRVFERYSWFGSNRVSMNVTMLQVGSRPVRLAAITSGGSQAMIYKVNTVGEEAFLDTLKEIL